MLHATKERSLGKLGGLIHRMPWVAWLALVGTLAIAGLPPLNGFVSEWLLLQAFLFTPSLPQSFVNMLVPVAAAALVLAVALAAYVMVKFYGVVFLGRPREANLAYAQDAGTFERIALVWLARRLRRLLGLFPVTVIALLDPVNAMLIGSTVGREATANWLLLAPINADRSSYSPLIVLAVIAGVVLLTMQIVHRHYHGRVRKAPPWDCGFPQQTPRMQDTAEGFGQPIRQVFEPFFRIERHLPSPFDARRATRSRHRRSLRGTGSTCPIARARRLPRAARRPDSAGTHLRLPDLQLLHAARAAVLRPMSACADERRRPALPAAAARDRAVRSRRCWSAGSTSAARGFRTGARRRCSCPTGRFASCS